MLRTLARTQKERVPSVVFGSVSEVPGGRETAQRTSQGVEMDGEGAENAGMSLLTGAELRTVPSGRLKSLL